MRTYKNLKDTLQRIDGKGYPLYKQIKGQWQGNGFELIIDHVQGDPFANATKVRIRLRFEEIGTPTEALSSHARKVAYRDYLARRFHFYSAQKSVVRGTGKSGIIGIEPPSQAILERSSSILGENEVEIRFVLGLPADGRRIRGHDAEEMICKDLPSIIREALYHDKMDPKNLRTHLEVCEDSTYIRNNLDSQDLIAFVANGSILPRLSGIDDRPLENGIPFKSPKEFEVSFETPNSGLIKGLGIKKGVTLIVGGGYHGKSTILKAIERGVYNHIPGDGRERVITSTNTAKIRAEDGRQVTSVNISPFINNLPHGRSTSNFSSDNASGSTSQASNIIEAIEAGATTLLLDEDTSATNFMIRDRRMQELIAKDKEPITPFVDRVKQLKNEHNISTIIVMGGSGDYFESADYVIAIDQYIPIDRTNDAKKIAEDFQTGRKIESSDPLPLNFHRLPQKGLSSKKGRRDFHMKVRGTDEITFGEDEIDVFYVEQLIEPSQLRAIGHALHFLATYMNGSTSIQDLIKLVELKIKNDGIQSINPLPDGDISYFRPLELAACLNRFRQLAINPKDP